MKAERIKWIDAAKGICIFLVVFGHCITREGTGKVVFLNRLIYSFHMPLFFILSGINLKTDSSFLDFIKKRIIGILLPAYGFMILYNICMAVISIFNSNYTHYIAQIDEEHFIILLKSILCTRDSLIVNWWFLPALFTAQILLFAINKVPTVFWKLIIIVICLFLCRLNYCQMNIAFPFFAESAALALPFLAIGFYGKKLFRKSDNWIVLIMTILIWTACIIISQKCEYGAMNMVSCDIHNLPLFFAGGISGSYIVIYFAKKTESAAILGKLGTETLWIYGIHYIFLNVFCEISEKHGANSQFLYNLSTVFAGSVIILLCCYFIIFIKGKLIGLKSPHIK